MQINLWNSAAWGSKSPRSFFLHRVGSFFAKVGREFRIPQRFFLHRVEKAPFGPHLEFLLIRVLTVVLVCSTQHSITEFAWARLQSAFYNGGGKNLEVQTVPNKTICEW